jgi:hypothetical protein
VTVRTEPISLSEDSGTRSGKVDSRCPEREEAVAAETEPKLPSSEPTVVLDGVENVTVRTGMVTVLLDLAGDSVTVIVMWSEALGVS